VDEQDDDSMTLRFVVHDPGIGMPANRLNAIFESFRQDDSSTGRKYSGTGLGIGIAKRVAEMRGGHRGAFSIYSIPSLCALW